ncbi:MULTISPECIES: HalOD1 output domain-containing protein [unclassified Halorubrum]|uniref:HalOD1 output domain-containing protein n=1 Tax=unclassified Halorubrum TaxID=2642239 RepID=UPI00148375CF|nr:MULTISPECIES: HalOD1 output domain-containing protein [unclassified Halorubrum]
MGDVLASKIVESVADAEGVEPAELDFTLYEYVEPDAIELLAANEAATWTLTFELPKHDVTVTSDGRVLVDVLDGDAREPVSTDAPDPETLCSEGD